MTVAIGFSKITRKEFNFDQCETIWWFNIKYMEIKLMMFEFFKNTKRKCESYTMILI